MVADGLEWHISRLPTNLEFYSLTQTQHKSQNNLENYV